MAKAAKFGLETGRRIVKQTRRGEAEKVNEVPNPRATPAMKPMPDVFWAFILTEVLVPGGEASAYKLEWHPADDYEVASDKEGAYHQTTTEMVIRDTLGKAQGAIGDTGIARLLYNASTTTNAMVWEVWAAGDSLAIYQVTNDDYDFIYWDATIGGFYVFGRPMDESAEPIVIDGSADEEKLYITAFFRDQFDRSEGLGSFAKGRRFYTAERNGRREIVAPIFQDPRWMFAQTWDSTVPPGGVSRVSYSIDRNGRDELETYQDDDGTTDYLKTDRYHVIADGNGQDDDGSPYMRVARATERPIWAAVEDGADQFSIGDPYGPLFDSWLLYPGLPGYIYAGRHQDDSDGLHRALVIRDLTSKTWWAKAESDWVETGQDGSPYWAPPYVDAYPALYEGGPCYDDSETYLPKALIRIYLPRMGSSQDPNVHTDDYLQYTVSSTGKRDSVLSAFVGFGPYLDGKIHEIRMMASGSVGPGWALADGTANSVGNGGSGFDYRDCFPFFGTGAATGGATTHTHTSTSLSDVGSGGNVASTAAASNMPPWRVVGPYERIP